MNRFILPILGLALVGSPAAASTYSATLAAPAAGRFIGRDIVWSCSAGTCTGASDESRPVVLCESLAKNAGKIESFLADGRAFTASELDRCNASARAGDGKPLAGE